MLANSLRLKTLAIIFSIQLRLTFSASSEEVEKHLELGKKLLAQGQYQDALSHYHAAVEGDPANYLTHFRRATVYLAMGRSKLALPDLEKVIELKPDFLQARIHRGSVLLKQGRLETAKEEFEELLKIDSSNKEATQKMEDIKLVENDITNAQEQKENGDCEAVIMLLAKPIEMSPWDPDIRALRADCYMMVGKYMEATGDFRSLTKIASDPTVYYFQLSELQYQLGYLEDALREVRECLKLDPDHSTCFPHYKKLKKLNKQLQGAETAMEERRFEDAVEKLESAMKTEPRIYSYVHQAKTKVCHCYAEMKDVDMAMTKCNEALEFDENNVDALCDRAEMYILQDNFEDGGISFVCCSL
jgi:DnaJ family protein C protein 3